MRSSRLGDTNNTRMLSWGSIEVPGIFPATGNSLCPEASNKYLGKRRHPTKGANALAPTVYRRSRSYFYRADRRLNMRQNKIPRYLESTARTFARCVGKSIPLNEKLNATREVARFIGKFEANFYVRYQKHFNKNQLAKLIGQLTGIFEINNLEDIRGLLYPLKIELASWGEYLPRRLYSIKASELALRIELAQTI